MNKTLTPEQKANLIVRKTGLNENKDFRGNTVYSIRSDFKLPTTREADVYYETLYQTVVSQSVVGKMRGLDILESAFETKPMINGILEIFYQGLFEVEDYAKEVTIANFNAEENDKYQLQARIDYKKRTKIKVPREDLIQAFSSTIRLSEFVDNMIMNAVETFKDLYMGYKTRIITDEKLIDGSINLISPVYDKYFDTTTIKADKTTFIPNLMKAVKRLLLSLKTPSNDHLAITNPRIKYASGSDKWTGYISPKLYAEIAEWKAVTFNFEQLNINIEFKPLDYAKVDGVTIAEANKIDIALVSEGALIQGFQIEDYSEVFQVPGMASVMYVNNWFGFATIPTKPKYMFKSIDTAFKGKITAFNNAVEADPNEPTRKLWQIEVVDVT